MTDSIFLGQDYTITVTGQNAGAAVAFDGTWTGSIVVKRKGSTAEFKNEALTIAGGNASITFDTALAPWAPGLYLFQCTMTDSDGEDYPTEIAELAIKAPL